MDDIIACSSANINMSTSMSTNNNSNNIQPTQTPKDQYRLLKKRFKFLVFENECYQEELRNLQRKLLKLSRDKNFLLDRLMQYEKLSDSSDDSDSSQTKEDKKPKRKARPSQPRKRPEKKEELNKSGEPNAKKVKVQTEINKEGSEEKSIDNHTISAS